MKEFESANTVPLTEPNLSDAAKTLGCTSRDIKAVSHVEAPNGGFIASPDNRPVILFESHAFHTLTNGVYDGSHSGISTNSWQHNYGTSGSYQYDRLNEALSLNRNAALQAASWGKYQIMGLNYKNAGYDSVEEFVKDMATSEAYQLDAFVAFLQNTGIDKDLANEDWHSFAWHYNGSGQVDFYTSRIKAAFDSL